MELMKKAMVKGLMKDSHIPGTLSGATETCKWVVNRLNPLIIFIVIYNFI